jgi:hypothetical protein
MVDRALFLASISMRCKHGEVKDWCAYCRSDERRRLGTRARNILTSKRQIDELGRMQVQQRDDCVACFSCNRSEVWPFVTFGRTPLELRTDLTRQSSLLDEIVGQYRAIRPRGGRFLITYDGAFDCQRGARRRQFLEFAYRMDEVRAGRYFSAIHS